MCLPKSNMNHPIKRYAPLLLAFLSSTLATAAQGRAPQVSLATATIFVDAREPSYVQYGVKDLSGYLGEIAGETVSVSTSPDMARKGKTVIAVGKAAAVAMGVDLGSSGELGEEGFVIRSAERGTTKIVVVAGENPRGTNAGIATLLQLIRAEGKTPYLDAPVEIRSKPSFAVRGIHLNGWPLNYPYAFRAWKEEDWKRFVDIAWAQRVNLLYLWPFMEIVPVPLSKEDEGYLEEVKRVVEYAQKNRGMEVWIMQSANRVGVTDCGIKDPRMRTYWVNNCQKDMNPADGEQFARIEKSFEALYRVVNNADGFCLIDSDPGGWPQSPLSDQVKIFQTARKLLDRYNTHGTNTKLIDWMWIGWGRHWGHDSEDDRVAFMAETIRNFKNNLAEPWELIAGMSPYLKSARDESALGKTVYLHYGAIEMEPAFPATNLGLKPVQEVFDQAADYPGLRGIMGNNELMSLQFPRTYFFFQTAWDVAYKKSSEGDVLRDLARQLYPDHVDEIAQSFLALQGDEPEKIQTTLARLSELISDGTGRAGPIGRHLFPDKTAVARNIQAQLSIRLARQTLLKALKGTPTASESARLVEDYFDKLLAWNKETGWNKMIDITIWRSAIFEEGRDFSEAMSVLKKAIGQGSPYTSYAKIDAFFTDISTRLLQKYEQDSVMVGCVEPFKRAVIDAP